MGGNVADLTVAFRADITSLRRDLDQVKQMTKSTEAQLTAMGSAVKGAFAALGGTAVAIAGVRAVGAAIMEQERAAAKLDATLRATGGAVGLTRVQLEQLANTVASRSLFDDDALVDGIAVLTTFRNVQGDVFKEGTQLAADMATVMGTDLQSAIVQVGKALNDPVKGITALQRVGVTFSEQQKDQIEKFLRLNDLAGAQRVILSELAHEFGGAGSASNTGLTGAVHEATMAWDNFLASLGKSPAGGLATTMLKGLTSVVQSITPAEYGTSQEKDYRTAKFARETLQAEGSATSAQIAEATLAEAKALNAWIAVAKVATTSTTDLAKARKSLLGDEEGGKKKKKGRTIDEEILANVAALEKEAGQLRYGAEAWALYSAAISGASPAAVKVFADAQERVAQLKRVQAELDSLPELKPRVVSSKLSIDGGKVSATDATGKSIMEKDQAELKKWQEEQVDEYVQLWEQAGGRVAGVLTEGLVGILTGQENALKSFANSVKSILEDLAKQFLKMGILKLLGLGGGNGPSGGNLFAGLFHDGGDVTAGSATRAVPMSHFEGAVRFHTGGFPGLAADEVPAILQTGERVLSRREVAAGVGSGGSGGGNIYNNITLNVSSIDPGGARDLVMAQMPEILKRVGDAASRSRLYRAQLQGG